eukprot:RCo050192
MPKRETRTLTPECATVEGTALELFTYYCLYCSHYLLILDTPVERLPRRRTDGAFVLTDPGNMLRKHNMEEAGEKLLRREKGTERQHRYTCKGCGLMVAYQSTPVRSLTSPSSPTSTSASSPNGTGPGPQLYLYLSPGILTRSPDLHLVTPLSGAMGAHLAEGQLPGCIQGGGEERPHETRVGVVVSYASALATPGLKLEVLDLLSTAVLVQLRSTVKPEAVNGIVERVFTELAGASAGSVSVMMEPEKTGAEATGTTAYAPDRVVLIGDAKVTPFAVFLGLARLIAHSSTPAHGPSSSSSSSSPSSAEADRGHGGGAFAAPLAKA